MPRIYLDNAATSWPKPEAVYAAVEHAMRELGAAAGRSPYAEATEATASVEAARAACAASAGHPRSDAVDLHLQRHQRA